MTELTDEQKMIEALAATARKVLGELKDATWHCLPDTSPRWLVMQKFAADAISFESRNFKQRRNADRLKLDSVTQWQRSHLAWFKMSFIEQYLEMKKHFDSARRMQLALSALSVKLVSPIFVKVEG